MNKLLMTLAAFVMTVSLATPQLAEAKRFGGGSSLGQQKSMPIQQRKAPAQQQTAQPPRQAAAAGAAGAATGSAKWLGPLAGLAAGGLLAWMIFGEGFEGFQFMDVLLFGLIALGLFMFLRARRRQQQPLAYETPQQTPMQQRTNLGGSIDQSAQQAREVIAPVIGSGLSVLAEHHVAAPAWFDEAGFVENAKQHFIALQKAWDQGDAAEIESYCTPQLYAQLQALMADIVVGENHTEVDTLYTEIVDQSNEADYFVVSVRFSGFIKESHDEPSHAFNEVWHIRRLQKGEGNWQIAGIQQVQ